MRAMWLSHFSITVIYSSFKNHTDSFFFLLLLLEHQQQQFHPISVPRLVRLCDGPSEISMKASAPFRKQSRDVGVLTQHDVELV